MERDFYRLLGISESATQDEIKKAYRSLAKKYHPDRTKGDRVAEEKFKTINEAYETLRDEKKRAEYDRMRKAAEAFSYNGFREDSGEGAGQSSEDLDDFLKNLFKQEGYRKNREEEGRDLIFEIQVPFEMAANGGEININVPREGTCQQCGGTGAQPGFSLDICSHCQGKGFIQSDSGPFRMNQVCPKCMGRGKVPKRPCLKCMGSGVETRTDRLTVKIPRGIDEGSRIRLEGLGQGGMTGKKHGDLYLMVHILPHPRFTRRGQDIYSSETIDAFQAILGGYKRVRVLNGVTRLKIPQGIQPGTKMKLKGQGIKGRDGSVGDHYVQINVSIPKEISEKERKMIKGIYEKRVEK